MALLQLVKKALLLLNMVLMLLLNMAGNGIAADTKKGITSAKDSAEVYNPRFCLARTVFVCLFACPRSLLKEEKIISSV